MLRNLTGEDVSARDLAADCSATTDEVRAAAEASMRAVAGRRYPDVARASLDATIRIVHGTEVLADNSHGDAAMCDTFEEWIRGHYPAQDPRPVGQP
jgi:hypothetical protein